MSSDTHAGTKRPFSALEDPPSSGVKKPRTHRLHHSQYIPSSIEPAPQGCAASAHTPDITRAQLLKTLSASLALAGFDAARPEALESLRAHTEEYLLHFARHLRTAMHTSRRTQPTASDFSAALAHQPNTSSASLLAPHLDLHLPPSISSPALPGPDPAPNSPAPLTELLQPLLIPDQTPRPYIPAHFPPLPPRHTWRQTPVYTPRETDARAMRERMTEEGVQAEQALRKLATAAKAAAAESLVKAEEEKRKNRGALSGVGRVREGGRKRRGLMEGLGDVLRDVGEEVGVVEDTDGGGQGGVDVGMPEGVVVNFEMGLWRRGRKGVRP
ncbi:hypothetical protein B0A50_02368 [Salinomyces thailandicus]|uniref:Transcription initiation factor TFIID subunit 8 n=1 Tax=Salinomyces thailandicus TaxID=706561 RepID=A0A4U0U6H2_9PEZI|nr:hypothetical protein B0A50_02368 [Salinomyces thailandica]